MANDDVPIELYDRIVAAILTVAMHSGTPSGDAETLSGGVVAAKFAQKLAGKTPQALVQDFANVLKELKEKAPY